MTKIPTAAAAALAFLILLFSCLALGQGLTTPQDHGPLFWLVTAGFALQALGASAWLAALAARALADATKRDTEQAAGD
jgi:hypothetical protein